MVHGDNLARAKHELERSQDDPTTLGRAQVFALFAVAEELRRVNEQLEELRRLQKQTRDRIP
jgi:hypothetical protein